MNGGFVLGFALLYWTAVFIWFFIDWAKQQRLVDKIIADMAKESRERIERGWAEHNEYMARTFRPEVLRRVAEKNRLALNLPTEPRW